VVELHKFHFLFGAASSFEFRGTARRRREKQISKQAIIENGDKPTVFPHSHEAGELPQ